MFKPITDIECKEIIKRLAKRLNVDASLVTTRLMSQEDKQDMREGKLLGKALETHIKVWKKSGYPNYANGKTVPLAEEQQTVLISQAAKNPCN